MERGPRFLMTREARDKVIRINWSSDSMIEEVSRKRSALRYAETQARILEERDSLNGNAIFTTIRRFWADTKAMGTVSRFIVGEAIRRFDPLIAVHIPEINIIVAQDSLRRAAN